MYTQRLKFLLIVFFLKTVPKPQEGFTEITASDRGHILDGYPRSAKNPWGDFIGTWDFPKQIPGLY